MADDDELLPRYDELDEDDLVEPLRHHGLSGGLPKEFMSLLTDAAKLKQAKVDARREEWNGAADFMRDTMAVRNEVLEEIGRDADGEQLVEEAARAKEEGNRAYKAGGEEGYAGALRCYTRCISLFWYFEDAGEERPLIQSPLVGSNPAARSILLSSLVNAALVLEKQLQLDASIYAASLALRLDDHHTKALYRRATCLALRGDTASLTDAVKDLSRAYNGGKGSSSREVGVALRKMRTALAAQNKKDGAAFRNIFDGGQLYDIEKERRKEEEEFQEKLKLRQKAALDEYNATGHYPV